MNGINTTHKLNDRMNTITWENIKGILLDLDDTLYAYAPCDKAAKKAVYELLSTKLGVSVNEAGNAYMEARKCVHADLGGTGSGHSRLLYIQKCIEALKGSTDFALTVEAHDLFIAKYFEQMELREGVLEFLNQAQKKGLRLIIVTDLTAKVQFKKILHLGIESYIDLLITSEEAGKEKPAPDMFELALKKSGLTSSEVVMIGDNMAKDIGGAAALGIQAIHLDAQNPDGFFTNIF